MRRGREAQGTWEGQHSRTVHLPPPALGKHPLPLQAVLVSMAVVFPAVPPGVGCDFPLTVSSPAVGQPWHEQNSLPMLQDMGQPQLSSPPAPEYSKPPSSHSDGASLGHSSIISPTAPSTSGFIPERLCSKAWQH